MKLREAADRHGIKRTTLADRVSGRYTPATVLGRKKSLTPEAEERVAAWLLSRDPGTGSISSGRLRSAIRSFLIDNQENNYFKDNM